MYVGCVNVYISYGFKATVIFELYLILNSKMGGGGVVIRLKIKFSS